MARFRTWHQIKQWLKLIGPGFVTGASDDDPSGIATYSQTGAQYGYTQLWTSLFTIPFMITVQEMCGRIGLVTGKGIAGVMRKYYSRSVLGVVLALLLSANILNLGSDLGAMTTAIQLLWPAPFTVVLGAVTVMTLALIILIPYRTYANILKYLTLSLFAYVVAVLLTHQNVWQIITDTFLPTLSNQRTYWLNLMAILGTTISPYLFFWQADQEVEEEVAQHKLRTMGIGKPKITIRDIRHLRVDTVVGMVFSNLIMFCIMVTTAGTLHQQGITDITSATAAAAALKPIAGEYASLLFTLGIVGTGLLAVPVLAGSAAYALAETFRQKEGLYRSAAQAKFFYAVIVVATLIGMGLNYIGIDPFQLLYYTAILNGLCAPPLLLAILFIANNRQIMGKYVNGWLSNVIGIAITLIMTAVGLALLLA